MLIAAFEDQILFLAVLASSGSRFALCKVIHLFYFFYVCVICAESSLLRRRIKCDRSHFSNPVTSSAKLLYSYVSIIADEQTTK